MPRELDHPYPRPTLVRRESEGVVVWIDPALESRGVVVGFSERSGGVSEAPYDTLNLAGHVGDSPDAVHENRARLLRALSLPVDTTIHVPEQVHGLDLVEITDAAESPRADGLLTSEPGRFLVLCFADCVPVVLAAPGGHIAVVHAGWRGVVGGIVGKAVPRLAARAGCDARDVNVYIGPHIRRASFQVDPSVAERFEERFGPYVVDVDSGGGRRVDLEESVRIDLERGGIDASRIASMGVDTYETTDRFFSYRRSTGTTGRHGAFAVIRR